MSLKCFSHPTYLNTFNFPKELSLSTILHAILHATHFINKISFLLFSVPQTSSVDWDIHNRTACGNCLWTVAFLIWYQLTTFIHMHRFFFALFSSGQGSISREHRKKMYFFMPLVLPNAGLRVMERVLFISECSRESCSKYQGFSSSPAEKGFFGSWGGEPVRERGRDEKFAGAEF